MIFKQSLIILGLLNLFLKSIIFYELKFLLHFNLKKIKFHFKQNLNSWASEQILYYVGDAKKLNVIDFSILHSIQRSNAMESVGNHLT